MLVSIPDFAKPGLRHHFLKGIFGGDFPQKSSGGRGTLETKVGVFESAGLARGGKLFPLNRQQQP